MAKQSDSIKMVAMDFDLTLYDHSRPTDTLQLQPLFEKLHRKGILLGLASGRSVRELQEPLEDIKFPWRNPFPDFVICHEGEIRSPDASDWPGAKIWNSQRNQLVLQANIRILPHFEELAEWAQQNGLILLRNIQTNICGTSIVFETPEIAERARNRLKKNLSDFPEIEVSRNHHIVLAMPKEASKGKALAKLAELSGLHPEEVLAIGDNINDLSMLNKDIGFTIATVTNADPCIRRNVEAAGGMVSANAISLGVSEIFLHHFPSYLSPE